MEKIIRLIAQKPRIADILVGLIIIVGLISVLSLRSNFLPPEPIGFISVNVVYRGASPQEVEEEVIDKIEDNLEGVNGIDRVTSTASESFGNVRVELLEDTDPNEALQDINNAIDRITTFPRGMDTPTIFKEEILNYTMTIGLTGDGSLSILKDYAKNIKDELQFSPNLSKIFISGYPDEEIEIRLRENDLKAYRLTFDDVSRAVSSANIKASGGELKTDKKRF